MIEKIVNFFFRSHSILSSEFIVLMTYIIGLFLCSLKNVQIPENILGLITAAVTMWVGIRQGSKIASNGNGGVK